MRSYYNENQYYSLEDQDFAYLEAKTKESSVEPDLSKIKDTIA